LRTTLVALDTNHNLPTAIVAVIMTQYIVNRNNHSQWCRSWEWTHKSFDWSKVWAKSQKILAKKFRHF